MIRKERITLLYTKYVQDSLSAEELLEWMDMVQDPANAAILESLVDTSLDQVQPLAESKNWQDAFARFAQQVDLPQPNRPSHVKHKGWLIRLLPYRRYAAAALLCGLLGYGYTLWQQDMRQPQQVSIGVKEDVVPGGNMAILRRADGHAVSLSGQGELIVKEGALEDGLGNRLLAQAETDDWRTIEIPKKGQYKLQLSDGTQVWLNSASTLRFPMKFETTNRTVYLEGEAFFEVTKNAQKPFIVKSTAHEVKVLGTSFNLSAYPNEAIQTSLLTGAVEVKTPSKKVNLHPGMQSAAFEGQLISREVDVASISAWKDNRFVFAKEPLTSIMKKLERWYDVEFEIQPGSERLLTKTFSGSLTRYSNLSETLDLFSMTESLHYTIKGRRVYLKH
jgi:transmembrane sensor